MFNKSSSSRIAEKYIIHFEGLNNLEYTTTETQLSEMSDKMAQNLLQLRSSLCILHIISTASTEINKRNYGPFFGVIQDRMTENAILSVSKLYENNKKSATIKSAIDFIDSNIKNLELKSIPNDADNQFFNRDYSEYITTKMLETETGWRTEPHIDEKLKVDIKNDIIFEYETMLSSLNKDIEAIKDLRDQTVAHTDKKARIINKTTWEKVEVLLVFGVEFLDLIEATYLARSRSIQSDGARACSSFIRMLNDLEIVITEKEQVEIFNKT